MTRKGKRLILVLLFLCTALSSVSSELWNTNSDIDDSDDDNDSNGLIEKNPDYVEIEHESDYYDQSEYDVHTDSNGDDSDHDHDDEYDSEDEEENEDDKVNKKNVAKSTLNKALGLVKTKNKKNKSIAFLKRHRHQITVLMILFAFRHEISRLLFTAFTVPSRDGKGRTLKFQISPTAIMKMILFIDFMRKMQPDSSADPLSLSAGPAGLLAAAFPHLFKQTNNAYLPPVVQHYTFERINDRFKRDGMALKKATMNPVQNQAPTSFFGSRSGAITANNSTTSDSNRTTVVFEMKGLDTTISRMDSIRDKISFLLNEHRSNNKEKENESNSTATAEIQHELEVILVLESPGGSASDYGLAANQIGRLRNEPGITVTVCVDKVAASGGYMMACMSSPGRLFAAPFAVLGSIGVIGQTLNIHNTLQNWGVKPLVFRGGKDKAPIGLVGEITEEGMAKVQDMVDKTHLAFKRHVVSARPKMADDIDDIATGDVWLGEDALQLGLIDKIITSDEYIWEKVYSGERVLKLMTFERPRFLFSPPPGRIPGGMQHSLQSLFLNLLSRNKHLLQRCLSDHIDKGSDTDASLGNAITTDTDADVLEAIASRTIGVQNTQIYTKSTL